MTNGALEDAAIERMVKLLIVAGWLERTRHADDMAQMLAAKRTRFDCLNVWRRCIASSNQFLLLNDGG
jgi:hypothetical protein